MYTCLQGMRKELGSVGAVCCIKENSEPQNQWVHIVLKPQNQWVQKVMSKRSAGLCTRCTRPNAFPVNVKILMLIHKSFESVMNKLALFWLAWTVTIQSGANRNGALWSLTSMCTVNITKQHILYKCMKLDKAVFTWQGRRNHVGQGGHCDPPGLFLVLIETKPCCSMILPTKFLDLPSSFWLIDIDKGNWMWGSE